MILEGIVTTLNPDGVLNVAPMGPHVEPLSPLTRFELRPFPTSRTFANLQVHPEGVLHVSDDVLLLAQAAVGAVETAETFPASKVRGAVLASSCRAYEFRIVGVDASGHRVRMQAEVLATHRLRDFFGFNRAMYAVVEAAILATRIALLPHEEIVREYEKLAVLVEKTGGPREREAFAYLRRYLDSA